MLLIFSGSQEVFGSFPFLKYSNLVGQPSQGRVPVRVQILILISSPGAVTESIWEMFFSKTTFIIFAQIGEAPVIPEAIFDMGWLLLLPTQVETKYSLV